MRTISDIELRSLKAATDGAYLLAGGISRVVDFTRVSTGTLSKYASFNDENRESFIPVDVLIEVERRAKTPTITKEVAAILGYGLVPLSAAFFDGEPLSERDAHIVAKHLMALSQSIYDALADDGQVDALEKKIIFGKARKAAQAVEVIFQRLEAQG